MPTILLVRHGENDYVKKHRLPGRKPGIHLNDKGLTQAKTVAKHLKKAPIKAVYSSPLERTMETAKPIAKALKLSVIPRQGLIETNVGKWQGKKVKKLRKSKMWAKVQLAPSRFRFPGGERIEDAQHRFVEEIESLAGEHNPDDMLVCVSHADPIKLVVAYYLGLPLDMYQRLTVSPGSITALHIGEFGSRLLFLNYDLSLNFAQP
ncbi:MAG: histidine phosphatase family protein [Chloroflexota bacterium]|nr:MAG: histidine phosphatase family protein [Chloroflexota bacterium]